MNRLIDNPIVDSLGFTTVIGSVTMSIAELGNFLDVHYTIQVFVGLGGLVFLYYKIKNSRMDYKVKQRDFDEYEKEKEKEKEND